MLSVSSGGRAIAKYTFAPQKKITSVIRNGIDRPDDLEQQPAVHLRADVVGLAPAVPDGEVTMSPAMRTEKNPEMPSRKEVQRVDLGRRWSKRSQETAGDRTWP